MLLPLSLLFVGAVLFLNGIWMSGRIADREIVIINVVVAVITAAVAADGVFGATDPAAVKSAALTLLFTTTYLWVAYNRITGVDGRGLGWFSLFVAITVVPVAIEETLGADSLLALWLGLAWAAWAVLWFMYFLLLALQRPIGGAATLATLLCGIFTGWLPALCMFYGVLA
ncbi:AmiS/UreI family transporter [Defluviimonas sp. SAOS-178_SWC]|uniref:AmiS/UreI family transporter n=1 Tax=Defluviimonas sp. SAOS-178_SWC TaxID=3121287 RepID=UPI00322189D7